jgi:hypothetical protein
MFAIIQKIKQTCFKKALTKKGTPDGVPYVIVGFWMFY